MPKKIRDRKKINEAIHSPKLSELSHISSPLSKNDSASVGSKRMHSSDISDVLPSKKDNSSFCSPKRSRNIEASSPLSNNDNTSVKSKRMHSSVRSHTYPVFKKGRHTPEK